MILKKSDFQEKYRLVDSLMLIFLAISVISILAGIFLPSIKIVGLVIASTATTIAAVIYSYFIIKDRHRRNEEQQKAKQSQILLEITNETISYLKYGLNDITAGKVCRLIYEKLNVFAVAITDLERILAFVGAGSDHHKPGKGILTKSTQQTIKENKTKVLINRPEIGCPQPNCPLNSAIVIPLDINGQAVGTLKFYFQRYDEITENILTVAEGLARLLSTQLALAEVNRQTELTCQAELKALRAQINPHFLFNTLNTIAVFCRTKPEEAKKLLVQFADFFRKSLERNEEMVTLREELEYVQSYLFFERARFGDKLQFIEEIEPLARQKMVPALVLQPLVENAIKHGVSNKGITKIKVNVSLENNSLKFIVADNGIGISSEEQKNILKLGIGKGLGIGLYNINERLKAIYGYKYGLVIDSRPNKGTIVKFSIPLKEDNDVESAYS